MSTQEFFLIKFLIKKALDVYMLRALQGFIPVYDLNQSSTFKCFPVSPLCQEKLETIMGLWCACPQIFMILDFRCVCRMLVSCICVCVHVKVEVSGEGNMKCMYKPGLNCIFVCCQWFLFVLSDCQWVRFTKRTII